MSDLIEIIVYPFKKVVLLLFSLQIGEMTIGSLMIAAVILGTIFRLLVGQHMVSGLWSAGQFAGSRIQDYLNSRKDGGSNASGNGS